MAVRLLGATQADEATASYVATLLHQHEGLDHLYMLAVSVVTG